MHMYSSAHPEGPDVLCCSHVSVCCIFCAALIKGNILSAFSGGAAANADVTQPTATHQVCRYVYHKPNVSINFESGAMIFHQV